MTDDADDLAQRYLALWTQYLTTLLADPRTTDTLRRWASFTERFAYPSAEGTADSAAPMPVMPPLFGAFGLPFGPGGAPTDALAQLARRVDDLERRLAALERQPTPRRPRRQRSRTGA